MCKGLIRKKYQRASRASLKIKSVVPSQVPSLGECKVQSIIHTFFPCFPFTLCTVMETEHEVRDVTQSIGIIFLFKRYTLTLTLFYLFSLLIVFGEKNVCFFSLLKCKRLVKTCRVCSLLYRRKGIFLSTIEVASSGLKDFSFTYLKLAGALITCTRSKTTSTLCKLPETQLAVEDTKYETYKKRRARSNRTRRFVRSKRSPSAHKAKFACSRQESKQKWFSEGELGPVSKLLKVVT